MNEAEHLMICTAEEGAEIAMEASNIALNITKWASKQNRFGRDEKWPGDPDQRTNAQRLCDEVNDLLGVMAMLEVRGIIPSGWEQITKKLAKVAKVTKYLGYAREQGTLQ
jgi:hypothetical protein